MNLQGFKANINNIDNKGNFSKVRLSTARLDKRDDEWKWSNWFATFVGEAHEMLGGMGEGDKIFVSNAIITNEPYMKGDKKVWPGHNIVVFKWEMQDSPNEQKASVPDEDDIPF